MSSKSYTEPQASLHFAKKLNNQVWALLVKMDRTKSENELILHAAHGSAFHWLQAGKGVNRQRAEWLLAHVYTELEQTQLALHYANSCLESSRQFSEELEEFDWAYAYLALARAQALAGQKKEVIGNLKPATEHIAKIKDKEDKKLVLNDMASFAWFAHEEAISNILSSIGVGPSEN